MGKHLIRNLKQAVRSMHFFVRSYRYKAEITSARGIRERLTLLYHSFRRTFIDKRQILFFPDGPLQFHALFKVLMFLGYRYTSDPHGSCHLAIRWWLAFDGNPFAPENPPPLLNENKRPATVLNFNCKDISKARVSAAFEEVFGYSLSVDPRTYNGKCVMKSNWNALHVGQVIECPSEPREGNFVYQRLIRNETGDGLVEDMRVPIFGRKTPFVYLKYRSVEQRFVDRRHANKRARIAEVDEVLSPIELESIYRFCERIGLDYGEIDVLRDKDDGRIYIVDANNTPSGPPSAIDPDEGKRAVVRLARAFEDAYPV